MQISSRNLLSAISVVGGLLGGSVHAGPLPDVVSTGNLWTITFYNDSSPIHQQGGVQQLCFFTTGTVGTQLAGVWYSPTFFDWNGNWRQEGDQVFMTGDYAGDFAGNAVGHDGMQWELVTMEKKSEGYGHWHEWRENKLFGKVIGFGNAKFARIGQCPFVPPGHFVATDIESAVLQESLKAPRRVKADGTEAAGPGDIDIVPLPK